MGIIASFRYSPAPGSQTEIRANVYIELTDTATGQPTNGNNVEITYSDSFKGTVNSHSIIIPGQKVLIAQNALLIELSNDGNRYERIFNIVSTGTVPAPAPPVGVCDLVINTVSVDRPESAPGAADAQISINAFSSYLPLQYSLDNVNFQSSGTFSGLTGGIKTVYVRDANTLGCNKNMVTTIPTLTSLLIKEPSVAVSGNVSRWNAAFNPIVFTYQRKDFAVTNTNMNSADGKAKLFVNTNTSAVKAGDMVYVETAVYKGVYTVLSRGVNYVVIDAPYTSTAIGFININSLRPYYKVITEVIYTDVHGQAKTLQVSNRPDGTGLIKADLSNFLQSLLQARDDSDYTQTNYRDSDLSASYRLRYAEQWDDAAGQPVTSNWVSIPHNYYLLYAARQLGQRHGGNMAEYVPFANGQPAAKWLTDFAEPVYSNHFPFDIGFIYSEQMLGLDISLELVPLDINRQPLPAMPEAVLLLNEDNSWLVNQDAGKLVIARTGAAAGPLLKQLGLNRLLIDTIFETEAYYFNICLKYNDGGTAKTITQTQTVRIDKQADDQSVYLRWIGLTGSWNYYRFVYNQEVSLDVQNAVMVKNHVSDWETQDGIEEVISKSAGQKMKVMAQDLSVADIKGLQSIKYSPKVQMLTSKDPVKWQTVVINSATFSEYETLNGNAPFSVTFNLPAINIQSQ